MSSEESNKEASSSAENQGKAPSQTGQEQLNLDEALGFMKAQGAAAAQAFNTYLQSSAQLVSQLAGQLKAKNETKAD